MIEIGWLGCAVNVFENCRAWSTAIVHLSVTMGCANLTGSPAIVVNTRYFLELIKLSGTHSITQFNVILRRNISQ